MQKKIYPAHQGTHAMAYHNVHDEYGEISNCMEQQIPSTNKIHRQEQLVQHDSSERNA